jgi:hypothetical protein
MYTIILISEMELASEILFVQASDGEGGEITSTMLYFAYFAVK